MINCLVRAFRHGRHLEIIPSARNAVRSFAALLKHSPGQHFPDTPQFYSHPRHMPLAMMHPSPRAAGDKADFGRWYWALCMALLARCHTWKESTSGRVVRHHSVALAAAMSKLLEAVNKPTSQKFTSRFAYQLVGLLPKCPLFLKDKLRPALHPEMPVLRPLAH